MTKESNIVIELLKNAIHNSEFKSYDGIDWIEIYKICVLHSIVNIVGYAIEQSEIDIDEYIKTKFIESRDLNIVRDCNLSYEAYEILETFEENGIVAMPLKGIITKKYYPYEDMRSMGDIDILIRGDCITKARRVMSNRAYSEIKETENEIVYNRPPMISVELHKLMLKRSTSEQLYQYYSTVWDKVQTVRDKKYIYRMTDEDEYIYMMVHLAKHYKSGGIGIRSVLDVYLFWKNKGDTLNVKYLDEEFTKIRLNKFRYRIEELAHCWFSDVEYENMKEDIKEIADFIADAGTFGNSDCKSAAFALKRGSYNKMSASIKYFFCIAFPRYRNMIYIYPKLENRPFLLPFYWVYRAIDKVLLKKKSTHVVKLNCDTTNIEYLRKHFERIELNI